jgi:hypothetical protein
MISVVMSIVGCSTGTGGGGGLDGRRLRCGCPDGCRDGGLGVKLVGFQRRAAAGRSG